MSDEAKKYEIRTMQDIADMITVDNAQRFLKDFHSLIGGLLLVKSTSEMMVATGEASEEDAKVKFSGFIWIDDEKGECIATMVNKDTKKETKVDFAGLFKALEQYDDNGDIIKK